MPPVRFVIQCALHFSALPAGSDRRAWHSVVTAGRRRIDVRARLRAGRGARWKEMPGTELSHRPSRTRLWAFAVVVVATIAMPAAWATSPAHAQLNETTFEIPSDGEFAVTSWPTFTDALNEPCPPPPATLPEWTRQGVEKSSAVIHAPLPQAMATGMFMLAGNWLITRLWKKRKI